MNESVITAIGLSAALGGIVAVIPQVIKVVKTKSTTDLSLYMWAIVTLANSLWLVYGLEKGDLPIIISNGTQLVMVAIVLRYKIKYK